jgi:DNA-binding MarR family transcriptional regulator
MADNDNKLDEIHRSLQILVALEIQKYRAAQSDSTNLPPLELVLNDAGVTGREIARIMGKSPQAVSQAIQRFKAKGL